MTRETDSLRHEYNFENGIRGKYAEKYAEMEEMEILRSNEPLPTHLRLPTIFLAGSTNHCRDNNITSWRAEAIQHFKELGFKGSLYVPEPFAKNLDEQIAWERHGLRSASFVLVWVARDIRSEILSLATNIKFEEYVTQPHRITYGRPDWFGNTNRLDSLYRLKTGNEPVNGLKELIEKTLEKIPSCCC